VHLSISNFKKNGFGRKNSEKISPHNWYLNRHNMRDDCFVAQFGRNRSNAVFWKLESGVVTNQAERNLGAESHIRQLVDRFFCWRNPYETWMT
jgi:hypothetical protein